MFLPSSKEFKRAFSKIFSVGMLLCVILVLMILLKSLKSFDLLINL